MCAFLRHLLRHLRGLIVALWDQAPSTKLTRSAAFAVASGDCASRSFRPTRPKPKPDEEVWAYAKSRLANSHPHDPVALNRQLRRALSELQRSPKRLGGCTHRS